MSDDLTDRGPNDRARINVDEEWELRYWSNKFGCSPAELRAAVAAVGVMAEKVAEYLKPR